ncbi:15711_t:CDS:2, partial [Funneliformis geosporum]
DNITTEHSEELQLSFSSQSCGSCLVVKNYIVSAFHYFMAGSLWFLITLPYMAGHGQELLVHDQSTRVCITRSIALIWRECFVYLQEEI